MKTFLEVVNSPRMCKWNDKLISEHMVQKCFATCYVTVVVEEKYHLLRHEISKYL